MQQFQLKNVKIAMKHRGEKRKFTVFTWGRLDLAVLFTPSTPNRQNRNQVRCNICAGVRRSTVNGPVPNHFYFKAYSK